MELTIAKEKYYKTKSRIAWLNPGDKNTTFFNRKVLSHTARNSILALYNEENTFAVSFYRNLFSKSKTIPSNNLQITEVFINNNNVAKTTSGSSGHQWGNQKSKFQSLGLSIKNFTWLWCHSTFDFGSPTSATVG